MRHVLFGTIAAAIIAAPLLAASPVGFAALLSSPDRPAADKVRDADRKPAELLAFAGVRPGMKVAELAPGGGYYTRILSLALGDKGYNYTIGNRPSAAVEAWARTHGNVSQAKITPGEALAPEPVDVVWTTLNYHDYKNVKINGTDAAALYNKSAFVSLKPGGVYLINDHQTAAGAGASQTSTLHRIEDKTVIQEVEAAGFKLEARSNMLRHASDDHSVHEREVARGKTDQFVLRFRKPRR